MRSRSRFRGARRSSVSHGAPGSGQRPFSGSQRRKSNGRACGMCPALHRGGASYPFSIQIPKSRTSRISVPVSPNRARTHSASTAASSRGEAWNVAAFRDRTFSRPPSITFTSAPAHSSSQNALPTSAPSPVNRTPSLPERPALPRAWRTQESPADTHAPSIFRRSASIATMPPFRSSAARSGVTTISGKLVGLGGRGGGFSSSWARTGAGRRRRKNNRRMEMHTCCKDACS